MSNNEHAGGEPRRRANDNYGRAPMTGTVFATGTLLALCLAGGLGLAATLTGQDARAQAQTPVATPTQGPGSSEGPSASPEPDQTSDPTQPPGHDSDPGDAETDQPTENVVHHVVAGDTLSALSKQYGVSVDQLVKYNEVNNPNLIYAGSSLRVPYLLIPQIDPDTGEIVSP